MLFAVPLASDFPTIVLYLVFAGSFASYAGEWWPVVLMIAMLVNRVLTVVVVPDPDERVRKRLEAGWARTTALYVLLAAGTVFIPVPRLGVSDQVVGRADLGGGGLWVDEPHRVIAFGACYFSAVALLEARAQWRSHRTDADLGEASGRPVEVGADRP